MLEERKRGLKQVNEMYGLDIEVDLDSSWMKEQKEVLGSGTVSLMTDNSDNGEPDGSVATPSEDPENDPNDIEIEEENTDPEEDPEEDPNDIEIEEENTDPEDETEEQEEIKEDIQDIKEDIQDIKEDIQDIKEDLTDETT